jgi:hypothetical protein
MTSWALFGSFGLCFAISGFDAGDLPAGLTGFALMAAGFGAHVLINHIYGAGFSKGETALGLGLFTIAALGFVASWIVVPDFGWLRVAIGLIGFTALIACFASYMFVNHGVRGSFEMFDEIRKL